MQTETKFETPIAKHILIVEDDPDLRHIFGEVLEHHGYTVSEAATDRSGGNSLDLSLPDMTGIDTNGDTKDLTTPKKQPPVLRRPHRRISFGVKVLLW